MQLPLNAQTLNTIKTNIKGLATTYQTKIIPINQIGSVPLGRHLVEATYWPINEALKYFEQEGAIKTTENQIEIIKEDYFDIQFAGLSLPINFSIDKRIEANLAIMTGLYALLYDIENRLRYFIAGKLEEKYGADFISKLPRSIRDQISYEKQKIKIYILDPRNKDLEFIDFSDFKKIIDTMDIIQNNTNKQILLDKLDYLNETRTLVAHNNIVITSEIEKIKDYCGAVKNIIA